MCCLFISVFSWGWVFFFYCLLLSAIQDRFLKLFSLFFASLTTSWLWLVSVSESPFHLEVARFWRGWRILEFAFFLGLGRAWFIDLHGLLQSPFPGGYGVCLRLWVSGSTSHIGPVDAWMCFRSSFYTCTLVAAGMLLDPEGMKFCKWMSFKIFLINPLPSCYSRKIWEYQIQAEINKMRCDLVRGHRPGKLTLYPQQQLDFNFSFVFT